jgi:hypothetical protein
VPFILPRLFFTRPKKAGKFKVKELALTLKALPQLARPNLQLPRRAASAPALAAAWAAFHPRERSTAVLRYI